ncbi:MAG: major coat protein [Candidatus Saccharimonadales bacterium]
MKFSQLFLMVLFTMVFGIEFAQAALPAVVGTTITGIQTDGLALIDLVWPVVGAIIGGFILIKLFKRGASKI